MKNESQSHVEYFSSPVGPLQLLSNGTHITGVNFVKKKGEIKPHPLLSKCKRQLQEYFDGSRTRFDLPLSPEGTTFQSHVWGALQTIPFGQTASYGEIAQKIDNPQSSRAVGGANNKNPISIIIPCHRIIGSSGKMVGYGGGLDKKEWLLKHEGAL